MALLYYWRPDNYKRDRAFGFGYHLNQGSPAMRGAVAGDSLWAFTRRQRDGQYVLAAELIVRAVTQNPKKYRYGRWRIWGDVERSRYFDVDVCPRVEPVVRELGVSTASPSLGRSFQGHAAVRRLSEEAHRILSAYSGDLPVLERVAIYPEDEFEARLVHDVSVRDLILRETEDKRSRREQYLYDTLDVQRARKHALALQDLYAGRCQICRHDPRRRYGCATCQGHHIQWLSRGGADDLENMVLVCTKKNIY